MKIQNKGAVLVQIAPLFISQLRNQNQSIESPSHGWNALSEKNAVQTRTRYKYSDE